MGIKTNELPILTTAKDTDYILADTAAGGTARLPIDIIKAEVAASDITPEAIGAAKSDHTHTPGSIGAATAKAAVATIAKTAWNSSTLKVTISVAGVTADTEETHVIPTPADRASKELWDEAMVFCDAQGNGTLTFSCETVPTGNITVNILIVGC